MMNTPILRSDSGTQAQLLGYQKELEQELKNILAYWQTYAIDPANGGFYGKVGDNNTVMADAPKGGVLNSRILWTFSAAFNHTGNPEYLPVAERAYQYLQQRFRDGEHGGVYWSVDFQGQPLNRRKQIYGLAFAIYGLSEYYQATRDTAALGFAKDLFYLIEQHSFDFECGGYFEAFAPDWTPLDDLRLSDKDVNEKKTMNTHLHILEAYTSLYRIWPDANLARQIRGLLDVFQDHIINPATHHLHLFLDENWNAKSDIISYGHDIEASWLLVEAAEVLHEGQLTDKIKNSSVRMAFAAARGLDPKGGLNYEAEPSHWINEKHWWVQAEAMVGFFNAWQLNKNDFFLRKSLETWNFTKQHLLDKQHGEWRWGVKSDGQPMAGEDKIGFWKCPYHNARACMEIIRRIRTGERL